jgi:hypothetical protein
VHGSVAPLAKPKIQSMRSVKHDPWLSLDIIAQPRGVGPPATRSCRFRSLLPKGRTHPPSPEWVASSRSFGILTSAAASGIVFSIGHSRFATALVYKDKLLNSTATVIRVNNLTQVHARPQRRQSTGVISPSLTVYPDARLCQRGAPFPYGSNRVDIFRRSGRMSIIFSVALASYPRVVSSRLCAAWSAIDCSSR